MSFLVRFYRVFRTIYENFQGIWVKNPRWQPSWKMAAILDLSYTFEIVTRHFQTPETMYYQENIKIFSLKFEPTFRWIPRTTYKYVYMILRRHLHSYYIPLGIFFIKMLCASMYPQLPAEVCNKQRNLRDSMPTQSCAWQNKRQWHWLIDSW